MSAESGLPSVDPEVLERAYDAAGRAIFENFEVQPDDLPWEELHATDKVQWLTPELGRGVKAAAPVVAAAAYRQGREDGLRKAQIEFSGRTEKLAQEIATRTYSSAHLFQTIERIVNEIRSLLTDKEGEERA